MPEIKTWGASPDDWDHFDIILGLGADLLPVVSNPSAVVSKRSTIRALGKVPSLYNKEGKAVGILDWTSKETKPFEIDKWSKVRDYGICLQTRAIRALDIDVEDSTLAAEIESVIFNILGFALPKRYRADSAKRLFAFQAPILEKINKRVLKVEGGIIELLGDGQQAVVIGTHPKGCRYEWTGGLPDSFPVIDIEPLWAQLVERFGTGEGSESSGPRKAKGDGNDSEGIASDEVSESLEVLGIAKSIGREGQVYIECPWKHGHTDAGLADSETGTAYFPAGGRGYEMGHFKCLHAHCAGRGDSEFRVALGLEEEGGGFEALPPLEQSETAIALPLESIFGKILKQNEDGRTLAVIENVALILNSPKNCGRDIRYDTFRDEIVYKLIGGDNWNPFTDTDYTELRISLANTGFLPISHEMMRQAVHLVAKKRIFDTAIEWINTLKWDGIERVKHFNEIYMGAELDEYNSAVSEYMWAALAGRILSPGCKADAAPIFVGEQFVGKTYAVMNMVPDLRYYCEINFEDKDDDLARKMRGKLVAEFAEMRGFQGRDSESTKAFISRQYEEWTPKYMEFVTIYPRRLLFIGTSNRDELFTDETGNRREFPVRVSKANIELIKKDRSQLWAEGKEMFLKKGVEYYYRIANDLAKDIRAEFMITDAWDDKIYDYLYAKDVDGLRPVDREYFLVSDIMHDCLGFESKNMKTYDAQRIGKILRKHDCEKFVKRQNGYRLKVWRKKPG